MRCLRGGRMLGILRTRKPQSLPNLIERYAQLVGASARGVAMRLLWLPFPGLFASLPAADHACEKVKDNECDPKEAVEIHLGGGV
ncbi:MAG: hypothetical protein WD021_08580 [Rhodothermales bacterium]